MSFQSFYFLVMSYSILHITFTMSALTIGSCLSCHMTMQLIFNFFFEKLANDIGRNALVLAYSKNAAMKANSLEIDMTSTRNWCDDLNRIAVPGELNWFSYTSNGDGLFFLKKKMVVVVVGLLVLRFLLHILWS